MTRARLSRGAAVALAFVVFATGAPGVRGAGQAQDATQPTFRTGVNLVRLDVSVTDGDGRPITDLEASDFQIQEDGVTQTAETVELVQLDGQPPPDATESLDIRSREHGAQEAARDDVRVFAIFFDDYHVDRTPSVTIPMRTALRGFIDGLGPSDLVAMMDPLTPLDALTFTRSKTDLLARIEQLEGRRGEMFPVRGPMEEAQLASGRATELRAGVSLSALNALVTYLGGLKEGRKSVLFVSQGPPIHIPGSGLRDALNLVLRSANRANVTINTYDPRTLGSGVFGGTESVSALAAETGGRKIVSSNAPARGLARIIEDASTYYLVGYTPARDLADGAFHRVDVSVTRRGARVTARRGYWAPSASEMTPVAPQPVPAAVGASLERLAASTRRRALAVWVGTSRGPGDTTRVTVAWDRTGGGPDTPIEPPDTLDVHVTGADGTDIGTMQTITSTAAPFETSEEDAGATAAAPASQVAVFDIPPADVTLRFEARAASGLVVDRWAEGVTVPDYGGDGLTLATPRLLVAGSPYELRRLLAADEPVPSAARTFRRTHRVFVELQCYQAPGAAPSLTAALLSDKGVELAPLQVPAAENGRVRFELPVSSLAPGSYVLSVKAEAGGESAETAVAFSVEN